jgi:uncharacterized protein with NRDE domain
MVLAYGNDARHRLIVAANRDEFHARPTAPAEFWHDFPDLLAGRDLQGGGTWMGITRHRRFAALTNFRDPKHYRNGARSRGLLVKNFLVGNDSPAQYLAQLMPMGEQYNSFNLIVGDQEKLFYCSSLLNDYRELPAGIYGLSNHLLDTPWPKVVQAKKALAYCLTKPAIDLEAALLSMLRNDTQASSESLPDTGIGLERERVLSSIFIRTPEYGTRASTLLVVPNSGDTRFVERSFSANGSIATTQSFTL